MALLCPCCVPGGPFMGTAFGGMGGMGSSGGDEDARPSLSVVASFSISLDPWFGSFQCYIIDHH